MATTQDLKHGDFQGIGFRLRGDRTLWQAKWDKMGQDAYLAFLAGNCMINCPQSMKEVEIEKLIEMGESSTVEFKRLLPSEDKKVTRWNN